MTLGHREGVNETELMHDIAVRTSYGCQSYTADEVFRLLEITRRMKNTLERIDQEDVKHIEAVKLKSIAREGLYG